MNIKAKHSLGQNFLINQRIVERIIDEANLTKKDQVLEIGPGKGVLTFLLAEKADKVVAVEKDKRLINWLTELAEKVENVQIIESDILKIEESEVKKFFQNKKYKIVANLPYNITSHFLKKFLETDYQPQEMLLMVQKEVGERIVAKAGDHSLLSLSVQFFCNPEIVFNVPRGNFSPAPKVDSVIINLKNISQNKFKLDAEKFFSVIKPGFSAKRKVLRSNLEKFGKEKVQAVFAELGLAENVRAQELTLEQWVKLALSF